MTSDYIDYSHLVDSIKKNSKNQNTVTDRYDIPYNHDTIEKYRALRRQCMDPFTFEEIPDDIAFKVAYMWDPYTGDRLNKLDPNGPLYFDPDSLIKIFYTNRLRKLWVEPTDETHGFYSGHYDDAVGNGPLFNIAGRGEHPEWYLFRLPIIDCYLTKDYNPQHITLGPILTDEDIALIDTLAAKRPDNYKKSYNNDRPLLVQLKKYYDIAIQKVDSNNKDLSTLEELTDDITKKNMEAVEKLKNMRG